MASFCFPLPLAFQLLQQAASLDLLHEGHVHELFGLGSLGLRDLLGGDVQVVLEARQSREAGPAPQVAVEIVGL